MSDQPLKILDFKPDLPATIWIGWDERIHHIQPDTHPEDYVQYTRTKETDDET